MCYIYIYIHISIDLTRYGIKQACFFLRFQQSRQLLHSLDNNAAGCDEKDKGKPRPQPREAKPKKEQTLAQKAKSALSKASGKLVEGKGWDKALQVNKTQPG